MNERLPFNHEKTDWLEACGVKDYFMEDITLEKLPSFFEKLKQEPYDKQLRITAVLISFIFFDKTFISQLTSIAPFEGLLMEIVLYLIITKHKKILKKSEFVEYLEYILSSFLNPNNILLFLQVFLIEIMFKKYFLLTLEYQEEQKETEQNVVFH